MPDGSYTIGAPGRVADNNPSREQALAQRGIYIGDTRRRRSAYFDPRRGLQGATVYPNGLPTDHNWMRNFAAMQAQGLKAPSWMNAAEKSIWYSTGGRVQPGSAQWNSLMRVQGMSNARGRQAQYSDFLAQHGGQDPNRFVPTQGQRPTYYPLDRMVASGRLPAPRVPINPNPPRPFQMGHTPGWRDGQGGYVMPNVVEPMGHGGPPPGTDPPLPAPQPKHYGITDPIVRPPPTGQYKPGPPPGTDPPQQGGGHLVGMHKPPQTVKPPVAPKPPPGPMVPNPVGAAPPSIPDPMQKSSGGAQDFFNSSFRY